MQGYLCRGLYSELIVKNTSLHSNTFFCASNYVIVTGTTLAGGKSNNTLEMFILHLVLILLGKKSS